MDERMRFVMESLEGTYSKAELCRIYEISRPTGDKWLSRYAEVGVEGLRDRSRAPQHHPNGVSEATEAAIVALRQARTHWGPKKLRVVLAREKPGRLWPATSTIGEILKRHGLTVPPKRRRRTPPSTQPFAAIDKSNALWCVDHKGWFRTGDGGHCEPLTMTDAWSRYLLRDQAVADKRAVTTRGVMEAAFREYGLPWAILSDNGPPFASRGVAGLSQLSVWWVKLEIVVERIEPGHPEQNGRHERMHKTLKQETAHPPQATVRRQQEALDRFRWEFNEERPHEALGQRTPASVYTPSPRAYPSRPGPVEYPGGWPVRVVQQQGQFYWKGTDVFLGAALYGERVGLEPVDERYWTVRFAKMKLGVFDAHLGRMLSVKEAARLGVAAKSGTEGPSAALQGLQSRSPTQ
jgi:transposase InsO family protein